MKNLAKFLLFVLLLSAGISLLYDYRLKHGGLKVPSGRTPEKYTFASESAVNPKQVADVRRRGDERDQPGSIFICPEALHCLVAFCNL